MTIQFQERGSDSPFIERVTLGHTLSAGQTIRPATNHWHIVFARFQGRCRMMSVGPWTSAGLANWGAGAEVIWLQFRIGSFMPGLPPADMINTEHLHSDREDQGVVWFDHTRWEAPSYENMEAFVARMARLDLLRRDPVVQAALADAPHERASRTVRERFQRATSLSHSHIRQVERAQQAAALLAQGYSSADTMFELGYFDQPHLTRSLKRFVGYTPSQIIQMRAPIRHSIQDAGPTEEYDRAVEQTA